MVSTPCPHHNAPYNGRKARGIHRTREIDLVTPTDRQKKKSPSQCIGQRLLTVIGLYVLVFDMLQHAALEPTHNHPITACSSQNRPHSLASKKLQTVRSYLSRPTADGRVEGDRVRFGQYQHRWHARRPPLGCAAADIAQQRPSPHLAEEIERLVPTAAPGKHRHGGVQANHVEG